MSGSLGGGNGWDSTVDFGSIASRITSASGRGVGRVVDALLTESKKILPTEGGDLDASGSTSTESNAGSAVGAASYDTEYAVRQHEQLDLQHEQGESAKYLERPFHEAASSGSAAAVIAEELREVSK